MLNSTGCGLHIALQGRGGNPTLSYIVTHMKHLITIGTFLSFHCFVHNYRYDYEHTWFYQEEEEKKNILVALS